MLNFTKHQTESRKEIIGTYHRHKKELVRAWALIYCFFIDVLVAPVVFSLIMGKHTSWEQWFSVGIVFGGAAWVWIVARLYTSNTKFAICLGWLSFIIIMCCSFFSILLLKQLMYTWLPKQAGFFWPELDLFISILLTGFAALYSKETIPQLVTNATYSIRKKVYKYSIYYPNGEVYDVYAFFIPELNRSHS